MPDNIADFGSIGRASALTSAAMMGDIIHRAAELPPPLDLDAARRAWTQLQESGVPLTAFEAKRSLLDAVFGGSPFLRELILRDVQFAAENS